MASRGGTRERDAREARRRSRAYSVRQSVHADRALRRRRDDRVAAAVFVVLVALATAAQIGFFTAGPGAPAPSPSASTSTAPAPTPTATRTLPPASQAEDRAWTGTLTIDTTELAVRLDGKRAPQAVASFVALARDGYFDGTPCHRLTTSAGLKVLQCGDPTGTGTGGPGYSFGPLENVPEDGVYEAGTIAMARGQAEDSQGSQFFIVTGRSELPAPGYTVFGRVTEGLDALRSTITDKGTDDGSEDGAPKVPASIRSVELR